MPSQEAGSSILKGICILFSILSNFPLSIRLVLSLLFAHRNHPLYYVTADATGRAEAYLSQGHGSLVSQD